MDEHLMFISSGLKSDQVKERESQQTKSEK